MVKVEYEDAHSCTRAGSFGFNCWFAWAMLTLMLNVRNAGRVPPYFANLCISLRPLLIVLPIVAAAYCLWLWFQKGEAASRWRGLIVATDDSVGLVCVFQRW